MGITWLVYIKICIFYCLCRFIYTINTINKHLQNHNIDKLDENDDIDYIRRRAIRELNYDNSAKIFLKFKSRFWEKDNRPIDGGNSSTDLPIRSVIYPSYYKDDQGKPDKDGPAILLGSYTWANDAAKYSPYSQKENVKLCLENFKTLHPEVDLNKEWLDGRGNLVIHPSIGQMIQQLLEHLHFLVQTSLKIYCFQ
jgi:hypothetical protein